ncbi:MAG: efflux RND transporter periplasmic adaptor subunit [Hyphomicrobiaceae bacterium]|nr:efflux RND transporter periplasmic adaptor subunit [Hyphomicrobiaceae bacterium]
MVAACLGMLTGCGDGDKTAAPANQPAPGVETTPVVSKPIASTLEFVGQTEAIQSVDLRARVTGFLLEEKFEEGSEIKKGDVLFVIDPAEFDANKDAAAAKVAGVEATIQETELQLARYRELRDRGTASEAKLDEAKAQAGRARADLAAAKAELDKAELDVGYTKITAPIKGRIGKSSVDVGNLIGPDSGVLATINELDPIRVTFPVSEREFLNYKEAQKKGEAEEYTPKIKLANDQMYQHDGKFEFIDNRVDPTTGTIRLYLDFPNPDGFLLPGQFVNVNLVSSDPEDQLVVPQAAVQENQTGPFVLVVDKDDKVVLRPIKTGQRNGADIAVLEGLNEGESIIVAGIQKVRPGMKVDPVSQKSASAQN